MVTFLVRNQIYYLHGSNKLKAFAEMREVALDYQNWLVKFLGYQFDFKYMWSTKISN